MKKKMYCIGNGHIDPVWLWNWQEGFSEVKATFRSALDRMKEYPDFTFTASSTLFYEWIEKNNPAMLEEIKQRVKEARWEIVGGWLIEPDCNIPCGEAFVRQGLYGQRYLQKTFGQIASVGYNIDGFGHAGTFPQILTKSGMNDYVMMRPNPDEKELPGRVFWWCGTDGTKVLTYRLPYEYNTNEEKLEKYINQLREEYTNEVRELALFYGVGNHGGGPTKATLDKLAKITTQDTEHEIAMATTREMFDNLRKNPTLYPTVQDDLQHHATGCYSVHAEIKRYNRLTENKLILSERYCTLAKSLKMQPYPSNFEQAWKSTLFNQFHDTLAGTALFSAYEDARNAYGHSIHIADENLNYALQSISWNIGIKQEENMTPLVVFNPHPWCGEMVCETEIRNAETKKIILLDEDGKEVPTQYIQSESVSWLKRLIFTADMPSLGYRTFRLYTQQEDAPDFPPISVTNTTLENVQFKLDINPETGLITLFDKNLNKEIIQQGARLTVIEDKSDTWAHGIDKFDKEIAVMKPVNMHILEDGPVRAAIQVCYAYNHSRVTQDFRIYKTLDYIEVNVSTDWREPLTMLKLKFPVNTEAQQTTYEIPYGHITRENNGLEEPGQSWINCGELSIANTSKYGYSTVGREVAITLLKNAPYAHHDHEDCPNIEPDVDYYYTDNGFDNFRYALHPHSGEWQKGRIIQVAGELNIRPIIIKETNHEGEMPQKNSFLSVNTPQVVIVALKEAEDKDGLILRAYEAFGQPVDATFDLHFFSKKISAHFTPNEIKTFKIRYNNGDVIETNLLEL